MAGSLGGGGGARVPAVVVVVPGATHLPRALRVNPVAHPPTAHVVEVAQLLQFAEHNVQEFPVLKYPGEQAVHTVGDVQDAHPAEQLGTQAPAVNVYEAEHAVQVVASVQAVHPVLQVVHTPKAFRN